MQYQRQGESCWLVGELGLRLPARLARVLQENRIAGVDEVVASYECIAIFGQPEPGWQEWVAHWQQSLFTNSVPDHCNSFHIPVCYELGADLFDICDQIGMEPHEFISYHSRETYTCYAVGFTPGFAYLGSLPSPIHQVPRRDAPRRVVPAGSLGIALHQTGIYPVDSPGGWNLVGRTPLIVADAEREFFPIEAGDTVKFVPISLEQFRELEGGRLAPD